MNYVIKLLLLLCGLSFCLNSFANTDQATECDKVISKSLMNYFDNTKKSDKVFTYKESEKIAEYESFIVYGFKTVYSKNPDSGWQNWIAIVQNTYHNRTSTKSCSVMERVFLNEILSY